MKPSPQAHDHNIYWLLMQIMLEAKHRVQQIADQHGLTMMQSNALFALVPGVPLPMNALSTVFLCDPSNVTGIVDRLEKLQLVERQDHATDRRVKMIALTSKGTDLKNLVMAAIVEAEAERLQPILSASERETFRGFLERIIAARTYPTQP